MGRILIESGPLRGRRFSLPREGAVGIGRDAACAIRLRDAMASRLHCVLRFREGSWFVEDRKSRNGTFVNERPVATRRLRSGDVLRIGETLLSYVEGKGDSLTGAVIGGYQVRRRVGRGAVGTVYEAVQLSLERTVALKLLAPRWAQDRTFVRAFVEEARSAGRLNHPHVVQVYDAGNVDERYHYIAMEYLEGGTLDELLAREKRIPAPRAVEIGIDAASALTFAEHSMIVHRDVKPANLLLTRDGHVKLGDLGLAADLRAGSSRVGAGSPSYMAPEQIRGEEVDHRADIYALGATLYRAVGGRPPFAGRTIKEILEAKLAKDHPPLRQVAPAAPPRLSHVIEKMLARSPEKRFENASQVEEALREIAEGPRRRRARRGRPGGSEARGRRKTASTIAVAGIAGVIFVVALLLMVLQLRAGRRDGDAGSERGEIIAGEAPASSDPNGKRPVAPGASPRAVRRDPLAFRGSRPPDARPSTEAPERHPEERPNRSPEGKSSETELVARSLELLRRKVERDIEKGFFDEAADRIESFEKLHSPPDDALADLRSKVSAAAEKVIAEAASRADALLREGRFAAAAEEVAALEPSIPPGNLSSLRKAAGRIADAEKAFAERKEAIAEAKSRLYRALAAFDFRGALDALGVVDRWCAESETPLPPPAVDRDSLAARIALAERSWKVFSKAIDGRIESGEEISIALAPPPAGVPEGGGEPGRWRLSKREGHLLLIERGSGRRARRRTIAALDLRTEIALEIIEGATGYPGEEEDPRQGLGLLLLLRRGPERARELLLSPGRDPDALDAARRLIDEVGPAWLYGRLATAEGLLARYSRPGAGADENAWSFLTSKAASLLHLWRGREDLPRVHSKLRELYAGARTGALLSGGPRAFFHASEVSLEEGLTVALTYEFEDEQELEDFHAVVEGGTLQWLEEAKAVRLHGEYRLFRGDPFERRLGVSVWAPSQGYEESAPNINIAFWTREDDLLTPEEFDKVVYGNSAGHDVNVPADHFVFGHGYRLAAIVDERYWTGTVHDDSLEPKYVRQPTFVLLAGNRGDRLHEDYFKEKVWELPIGNTLKRHAHIAVSMDDGRLRWQVNGRPLPFARAPKLRCLKDKVPHQGSVTLLTNTSSVVLARIEVRGEVGPDWYRGQAEARARAELERIDPSTR